ncbi:hypothetical protein V3C99_000644 [Haemonchus contortus]
MLFRITEETVGPGKTCIAWRPNGNTLALASDNKSVVLYDKKGAIIDVLDVNGNVVDMAWDKEGDVLGIIVDASALAILWNINTRNAEQLDTATGAKELPLCLVWSAVSPLLAIGNSNGNLFIYNQQMSRKIPVLGKHQRKITGVAMTKQDEILCCSDDNTITVSSADGETIRTMAVSGEPNDLQVGEVKRPGGNVDVILSAVLGKKTLYLATLSEKPTEKLSTDTENENSMNLQFQEKYGTIVAHVWFNDGYMIVGFEKGFVVCISAHPSEMGQEIFSVAEYKTYLAAVAVSPSFGKILSVGDNQIKVREMRELNDIFVIMEVDTEKDLSQVECSLDGQLVAVASRGGGQKGVIINIAIEPSHIAVGPYHIAVATNNRVWVYNVTAGNSQSVAEGEYLSSVIDMQLNDEFICVMMEGKARLHRILNSDSGPAMTFPEQARNSRLVAAALSNHFFVFTTEANYLVFFSLEEWCVVSEYRHTTLIRQVCPDQEGLRVAIFDERAQNWVYSPVDDSMHKLPAVGSAIHYKAALWETFTIDRDTFIVYDNANIYVYLLNRSPIEDESVIYIGSTKLPFAHSPLMLSKGIVHCLTSSGKTSGVLLDSHRTDTVLEGKSPLVVRSLLKQALQLKRWMYAWRICDYTRDLLDWNTFAQAVLLNADAELALRIFRHIGDVSMGLALESIVSIEEKTLLAAHVSMLLGRYDQAEQLFLKSSCPNEALAMRRDLLDWSKALALAEQLSPSEIPHISREYAQQLEFMGDYPSALAHYENGIIENPEEETEQILEHNEVCRSGVARMSIRTGDIRRGIQLARDLHGRVVKRDCAIILEQLKQYGEAADLYELGQFYDRAAAVCLKAKAWGKVGELLPKVRSPKIHAQYGKIMEAEKRYKEAAVAYRNARDYDNLVRMLLDHLNMAEEAVKVVRESRSIEGAKLVAKFFSQLGDHASAIRFLVLSNCHQEAFQLAEATDHVAEYADSIEADGATQDQMAQLAEYFAGAGDAHNAGRFYLRAGHYRAALEYLMACGENHDSLLLAIECVAAAGDSKLTARLTDYLMGEVDEIPKDAKYLFRLYVALGMTREAATTAVVIARQEQERGSYTVARNVLLAMYQELVAKQIKVPYDMQNSLMIIHSYLIVKSLLRRNETLRAARMLIRTTANISRFPVHVVPILTSAVVVCSKAGLKSAAHRAAVQLMQPEFRQKIDAKYKKKIEAFVRKADKTDDPDETRPPCPHCAYPVPETELACDNCKSTIPYCIITGRHIVDSDFAQCPSCEFPGYYSEFKKLLAMDEICPMCSSSLKDVIPGDASAYLKKDKTNSEQLPP